MANRKDIILRRPTCYQWKTWSSSIRKADLYSLPPLNIYQREYSLRGAHSVQTQYMAKFKSAILWLDVWMIRHSILIFFDLHTPYICISPSFINSLSLSASAGACVSHSRYHQRTFSFLCCILTEKLKIISTQPT